MKKGFFVISDCTFEDSQQMNGVKKKILSEIKVLDEILGNCSLLNLTYSRKGGVLLRNVRHLFSKKLYNKFITYDTNYLYIRRIIPVTIGFLNFLKFEKDNNPNLKIIYEIPTYPYDDEHTTIIEKIMLIIDKINRKKLKKYVDLITTYTNDSEIFGIKALHLVNGIECSKIPISISSPTNEKVIRLIAVAQFAIWHGYDRLIEGIHNYYADGNNEYNIELTLVGNGVDLEKYRSIVHKYCLEDYVKFTGPLSGAALDNEFNNADIAINSLGCHRIGIYTSSAIKSREYLARGFPLVSSVKIDVIPENYEYCLMVSEDESPIDIFSIVQFYNRIYKTNVEDVRKNIRQYAEENCDMSKVMKPVVDFINND